MRRLNYSVDLPREKADKFNHYLKENGIAFEPSENYKLIHFEMYMNPEEVGLVSLWLDSNPL